MKKYEIITFEQTLKNQTLSGLEQLTLLLKPLNSICDHNEGLLIETADASENVNQSPNETFAVYQVGCSVVKNQVYFSGLRRTKISYPINQGAGRLIKEFKDFYNQDIIRKRISIGTESTQSLIKA